MRRSSLSSPPICAWSDPPGCPLRNALWCWAARPWAHRSARPACAASSAGTGNSPERHGCVRIGCATPTAPTRLPRGRPRWGRVRPHRLRHTYGTELAAAGIDLLALRELMGHVSPETTAGYVHLSVEQIAAADAA